MVEFTLQYDVLDSAMRDLETCKLHCRAHWRPCFSPLLESKRTRKREVKGAFYRSLDAFLAVVGLWAFVMTPFLVLLVIVLWDLC